MEKLNLIKTDIEKSATFSFSRSGGPGGQNVNKLNTNVLLIMPIIAFESLTEKEKTLIRERLKGRINEADEIFIHSNEHRSQYRNRIAATTRLISLIYSCIKIKKYRKNTKPTKASIEKRIIAKKQKSHIKKCVTKK